MALTDHLSSLATPTPYAAATAHPFLTSAASLSLPKSRLALKLAQDCIHPEAYPRFIAQLIAKIPLEDSNPTSLAMRTLTTLVECLNNIVRELPSFETTARKYELPLDRGYWRESKATRDYTAELARVGALFSLEDGLVFLWAMEKVHLDAWSTVYTGLPQSVTSAEAQSQPDLTARAIRDLSCSWSNANPEYVSYVKGFGELVDAYFAPVMADKAIAERKSSEALARAEAIWARAVELGAEHWPNEGDEVSLRVSE